jgi:O-antigen/teichoic acid export membrane protein
MAPRAVQVLVSLGLTPFIVHHVGLTGYGLWSVVQTFVTFLTLADFGFPTTTMRLVARARASGHLEQIHAAVNITTAFMLGVSVAVLLFSWGVAAGAHAIWPSTLPHGAAWLIRWTGLGLALTFVSKALSVVPQGFNRWDVITVNQLVGQLVSAAAVVTALLFGAGLAALGFSVAVGGATAVILGYLQARRLMPLRWGRKYLHKPTLRIIGGQGANLFVVNLVEATSLQADKFMLLPFASLRYIGLYAIGSRVVFMVRLFAVSVLGPLTTRVAAIDGANGLQGVREYYPLVFRKTMLACVLPMAIAAIAGYPGILAWLGASFRTSALVGLLLGLGFAINMVTGAGTATAAACGRADLDRKYSLVNLALNCLFSLALALVFGKWGILAGTLCGLIGSSWILVRDVDRWLGIPGLAAALDRRTGGAIVASVIVGVASLTLVIRLEPLTRVANLAVAAAIVLAMAGVAAGAAGMRLRNVRTSWSRWLRS